MKERPILFSAPMVRAILDGRKTQTRRVIKLKTGDTFDEKALKGAIQEWRPVFDKVAGRNASKAAVVINCPYGMPGDRLAVKEAAWMWCEKVPNGTTATGRPKYHYVPMREVAPVYAADHPSKPVDIASPRDAAHPQLWRLKIGRFLPRWASRIELDIVDVRVERLQDINEADAIAEGAEPAQHTERHDYGNVNSSHGAGFRNLWTSINGAESWDGNPWVWVVEFKRVEAQAVAA